MDSEEELIKKYSRIAKILSRQFFLFGGDSDDLYQEGMIALLMAIRTYDSTMNCSFEHYAECCIRRRMIDTIRLKGYTGYLPLPDDSDDEFPSPEDFILESETYSEYRNMCGSVLSKFEYSVLSLYLQGYGYSEIAEKLNKTSTSVYNAIQRSRQKLKGLSD